MRANPKQLNEVTNLVETGKVKTIINKVFPFKEAINAVLYVNTRRAKGKVVIKMK